MQIKKYIFPTIIALSALSVSVSAAFYSISGLSKLFAGASTEVIVMASSLEFAKLVMASLLYQYWDSINKLLRVYYLLATLILIIITSIGIYGFLTAAYQDTYSTLTITENQTEYLIQKKTFYEEDVARYDKELERISDNIAVLSNAKVSSIQVRDTSSATGIRNTISTAELRAAQGRISIEEQNRKELQANRVTATDSVQKYNLEILSLRNTSEASGELGPLKYLSKLFDKPMDVIINWLMLVIIFVFDPLAISLVVAANFAFNKQKGDRMEKEQETKSVLGKVSTSSREQTWDEVKRDQKDYEDTEGLYKEMLDNIEFEAEPLEVEDTMIPNIDKPMSKEDFKGTLDKVEKVIERKDKKIEKIVQKGPTKWRVRYEDGSIEWRPRDEVQEKLGHNKKKYF
jgi:hypothetical protein